MRQRGLRTVAASGLGLTVRFVDCLYLERSGRGQLPAFKLPHCFVLTYLLIS